jgi:hypothetical protein
VQSRELKEAMLAEWNLVWKSASEGRQTKVFWPEPDLKKSEQLMKLSRPTLGIMSCFGSGFAFMRRQSAIIEQRRNPPLGDVSCRRCGEADETPIHIICDCGSFVSHRLDTIGVHQMPETNPEWDINSLVKFLQLEEIILMEDCSVETKMTKGWTALAFLPPYLPYLLELLRYYILACIYHTSMPAAIILCVTCLVYYFYTTPLILCISILTCNTTLELPYGSAFMKINGA